MVSSNDVTITAFRDGSMSLNGFALDSEEVAALRAHFAAERMPEDVQKLVDEARETMRRQEWMPASLVIRLADALEAAYSQKGIDDEPR